MCGIVGAVAKRNITPLLVSGLKRLEYRGYDSAGLAVLDQESNIKRIRSVGKVQELSNALAQNPHVGHVGIAHTRWATHGEPNEHNAHPHRSKSTAIVHNGIIENYQSLAKELVQYGYEITSETDTEVMAHWFDFCIQKAGDLVQGIQKATKALKGAYAVTLIHEKWPDKIVAIRHGSPLVLGFGVDEHYVASDYLALLPLTQSFLFLEEDDIALISQNEVLVVDANGKPVEREIHKMQGEIEPSDKGAYRHYMQKEIFEQVKAIQATTEGRIWQNKLLDNFISPSAIEKIKQARHIQIVACGTSYHAGMVGKYWIESLAQIPTFVEIASEFRYRDVAVPEKTIFITISQSGETADTLAALRDAKKKPYLGYFAICNVPGSALVRESDCTLLTRAGVEIGVASTKAFTTQLVMLLVLSGVMAKERKLPNFDEEQLNQSLMDLPNIIEETLSLDKNIQKLAKQFVEKKHALFLGRGLQYPIALEGALKLKEVSYIHAEAYPAGELKHGPLALVDKDMPIIAVAPNDALLEKVKANLSEVRARGGVLFVFADRDSRLENGVGTHIIEMPHADQVIAPIVYTIPLQLLAYHVAVLKGTDVDQPRNLAKSVTVE